MNFIVLVNSSNKHNEIAQNLHIDELELEHLSKIACYEDEKFDYGQVDRKQTFVTH